MKVLYVSEFLNKDSRAAAFAVRSRALGQELRGQGLEVVMATTELAGESLEAPDPIRLLPASFKARRRSRVRQRLAATLPFLLGFARCLHRESPDLVISSFHDPQYGLLSMLASRLNGIPCIFDAQDSWLVMELGHYGAVRNFVRRVLERYAMRLASAVTTVSPTLRSMLVYSYSLSPGKVHVVYNGANPIQAYGRMPRDIDIIHLGSPRHYYDTLSLLEALAIVCRKGMHPRVVFLGCSSEPYVDSVKQRAEDLGLSDLIAFEGPVPPESVPEWLARSRIGIHTLADHPVYRCAIGIKVFEYVASGLPVVHMGPRDGETARLVAQDGFGIATTTVEELADALGSLLASSSKQNQLAAASRAIGEKHTWAASAWDLRRVLDGVA